MSASDIALTNLQPNAAELARKNIPAAPQQSPRHTSAFIAKKYWVNAKKAYHLDRYRFKGFEMLHLLSLQYYEKELCRMEHDMCLHNGIGAAEEETKLEKLRTLLKEYGECHVSAIN